MKIKGLTANKVTNLTGGQSEKIINLDEIFGWFLNITFALLFVFIIASFLFKTELKEEAEQAINERDFIKAKWDGVKNTPSGHLYDEREKTLIALQKQQLLKALDEIEKEDRTKFGLNAFSFIKENGSIEFNIDGILSGDKVFNNPLIKEHFIEGSKRAKQKLPYPEELLKNWQNRILLRAEKRLLEEDEKAMPIVGSFEIVEKTNQDWLFKEINQRIGVLYVDFCEFQVAVVTKLYGYYFHNPKALEETEISELLNKYFKATPEVKSMLIPEIEDKLYRQAKKTLENQGVMLLSGVQERLAKGGGK